jgi:two-component system, OmpR family, sensor histidine kinase ChvG
VLAINVLALAILAGGFLYLDRYQDELLTTKTDGLMREGQLIASALAGDAERNDGAGSSGLDVTRTVTLLQRLNVPTDLRVRLFAADGALMADTNALPGTAIEGRALPPPEQIGAIKRMAFAAYDWVLTHLPPHRRGPPMPAPEEPVAKNFPLATDALAGTAQSAIYEAPEGGRIVVVAMPLKSVRRVQGALLLTASADDVDHSVRDVRYTLVLAFIVALAITVMLSLYLAGTITRPVRRLADAADAVHRGRGRKAHIPDFTSRRDEIGGLSASLTAMTDTLWSRMDAIENFVADVAHEIKNPLTSVRSAIETAKRIEDPDQRQRLLDIVASDITRLDRLLSEIADASRIDTELARAEPTDVELAKMLGMIADLHNAQRHDAAVPSPVIKIDLEGNGHTLAIADRLAQVFRNLINNAASFATPDGIIAVHLTKHGSWIEISVEDDGPGVHEEALEKIFDRFYTDRSDPTEFGKHSGLGLAISRQIIEAHDGTIRCENRLSSDGAVAGARFTVTLPALPDDGDENDT